MKIRLPKENKHLGDDDKFGQVAESFAIFFGTPAFLIGQTIFTAGWIILNTLAFIGHWDPMPFIFLNLMYSIQSGYAAPLILLAQTRQSARDKVQAEEEMTYMTELANETNGMLTEVKELISKDIK